MLLNLQYTRKDLTKEDRVVLDNKMMDFLEEKAKNCPESTTSMEFVREFIQFSGSVISEKSLQSRFAELKWEIPKRNCDEVTKIKMMFVAGSTVEDEFLKIIKKYGIVRQDRNKRILEFYSYDKSWKLYRGMLAEKRAIGGTSFGAPSTKMDRLEDGTSTSSFIPSVVELQRRSHSLQPSPPIGESLDDDHMGNSSHSSFMPSELVMNQMSLSHSQLENLLLPSSNSVRRTEVVPNFQSSPILMQSNFVPHPIHLSHCQHENLLPPSSNPADHSAYLSKQPEVIYLQGSENPTPWQRVKGSQYLILSQFIKEIEQKPTEEELLIILDPERNDEPEEPAAEQNKRVQKEGPSSSNEEEPRSSVKCAFNNLLLLASSYESEIMEQQIEEIKEVITILGNGDEIVPTKKLVEAFREGFKKALQSATMEEKEESASLKEFLTTIRIGLHSFRPVSIELQKEMEEKMKELNAQDKKLPLRKVSYAIDKIFDGIKNLQKLDF